MEEALQAALDTRTPLADLGADDSDRKTDPKLRGRFFHGRADGKEGATEAERTHLVGRPVTIQVGAWDGERYDVLTMDSRYDIGEMRPSKLER